MKNLLLVLIVFTVSGLTSFAQNRFMLSLDSFNGETPKSAFSDITSGIEIHHRYINDSILTFQSEIHYTEYDITSIVEMYGYTVKEFQFLGSESGKTLNNSGNTLKNGGNQDCEDAIMVCNGVNLIGSSSGLGNGVELNSSNRGCSQHDEKQPAWYYINVGTNGTLEMVIDPDDSDDDFDWAIWGPFTAEEANENCSPKTLPKRCSASNTDYGSQTGFVTKMKYVSGSYVWDLTGSAPGQVGSNPGSNIGLVNHLNVGAGEVYILMLDNWSASGRAFKIKWGGSATLACVDVNLPVELTFFDGEYKNGMNHISWSTATETNNDYFTVEHSTDGFSWYDLDKIEGAGSSTITNNYTLEHRNFPKGINYYRLSQVDFDGKREVFPVISIDNLDNRTLVKRLNTMGQEVDENYKGIVIEYYDDNTIEKRIYL